MSDTPQQPQQPALEGRTLAALLAGFAALGGIVLVVARGMTETLWAWLVADPATAASLGAVLLAGAVMLGTSAAQARPREVRLPLAVTGVFAALALYATFHDRLLHDSERGIPSLVGFLWVLFLGLGLGGAAFVLLVSARNPVKRTSQFSVLMVAPALLPGVVTGYLGLSLFLHPLAHRAWVPWPMSIGELRLGGALLLAVAVGCVLAIFERDAVRLHAGAWGATTLGVLMGFVAMSLKGAFPWHSATGMGFLALAGMFVVLGVAGSLLCAFMPDAQRWETYMSAERRPHPAGKNVAPMADQGFFGPGSVAWRVWAYPTSLVIGFQRAVGVEELDPFLIAAVEATRKIRNAPSERYNHTIMYFATVAFGDSRTAVKASHALTKMHARHVAVEPVSGLPADPNNPETQLWILLTGWHSILKAYEMYGPGPLSPEDEKEYWAACAVAAQLQTCDPSAVPRTREEMRAYYNRVRPDLVFSPVAVETMTYLLNARNLFPNLPAILRPAAGAINWILRAAVIATLPRWMREEAGLQQSERTDRAIVPWIKLAFGFASRFPWLEMQILRVISPSTPKVVGHVLYGVPARQARTLTPAQAFEVHETPTPAATLQQR